MAQMKRGLYTLEPRDITESGTFKPDPNVSGQRFVPDGRGGGTLYRIVKRQRKGFRKLEEFEIEIRKQPFLPAMGNDDHGDDEKRNANGT